MEFMFCLKAFVPYYEEHKSRGEWAPKMSWFLDANISLIFVKENDKKYFTSEQNVEYLAFLTKRRGKTVFRV